MSTPDLQTNFCGHAFRPHLTSVLPNDMTPEYLALRQQVEAHRDAYYVKHAPTVDDFEFDRLVRQLAAMEQKLGISDPTSPTATVGSDLDAGFKKVAHATPMLSLSNIFSTEEIEIFFKENLMLIGEPKIDGLSLSLHYADGKLVQAITRGDGRQGDDVTANALGIASIPKTIAYRQPLEVRGEAYMKRSVFAELNKQREAEGEDLFKNPRNAASGSLKQKDSVESAKRKLDFLAYWADSDFVAAGYARGKTTDCDLMIDLKDLGFDIPAVRFKFTNEAHSMVAEFGGMKPELEYDIDGVVLKVNDLAKRQQLGVGTHAPKWAVAYKFPPERKVTRLLDIVVTIGKSGQACPNAVLAPLELAGTTVTAASLMNVDELERIGSPAIGDDVWVSKSGEIIPRVTEIAKRNGGAPWILPNTCPSCGTELIRDGVHFFCTNHDACPAQIEENLFHHR